MRTKHYWLDAKSKGYYEIPAVSLTNKVKNYDPKYLLLWLPNEELYGQWDCDHWEITVFPKARWKDIVANPIPYLNAMWDYRSRVGRKFSNKKNYTPKPGSPF